MKKIEAIIRPEKVGAVRKALEQVDFSGLTITQVDGHGKQRGTVQRFLGEDYKIGVLPKTKIEIVANNEDVARIVEIICNSCRTGEIGDGKIFVWPVEEVIKIRTGEKGESYL